MSKKSSATTEKRKARYRIVANPHGSHFEEIQAAVRAVNGLQTHFQCDVLPEEDLLCGQPRKRSAKKLAKALRQKFSGKLPLIVLTEESYKSGMVVVEDFLPDLVMVTVADWETEKPPAPQLFYIYTIASALISFEGKLGAQRNASMAHNEPLGCIFDEWRGENQLAVVMVASHLCSECAYALGLRGVSEKAFAALHELLEYVRRCMLGNRQAVPDKIFIAHGHSDDWKTLEKILTDLELPTIEFNASPVASQLTVDRWRQMLDESRFAFALLTPDDRLEDGTFVPRLNVVHEIGLCHARLGVKNTIVLCEESVREFSNISGVTVIRYTKGSLLAQKEYLRDLLVEHGILPS